MVFTKHRHHINEFPVTLSLQCLFLIEETSKVIGGLITDLLTLGV